MPPGRRSSGAGGFWLEIRPYRRAREDWRISASLLGPALQRELRLNLGTSPPVGRADRVTERDKELRFDVCALVGDRTSPR